jgi:uncharacterized membrane protein
MMESSDVLMLIMDTIVNLGMGNTGGPAVTAGNWNKKYCDQYKILKIKKQK